MIFSEAPNDFLNLKYSNNNYLMHHGIKGQKWGIRRYQNPDGTLTAEGRERYKKYEKSFKKENWKGSKYSSPKTYYSKQINNGKTELAFAIPKDKMEKFYTNKCLINSKLVEEEFNTINNDSSKFLGKYLDKEEKEILQNDAKEYNTTYDDIKKEIVNSKPTYIQVYSEDDEHGNNSNRCLICYDYPYPGNGYDVYYDLDNMKPIKASFID